MKLLKNIDYVELYAEKLREDNSLFIQQKRLIEAQMHGSSSLFKKMYGGADFKQNARKYLRGVGLLR